MIEIISGTEKVKARKIHYCNYCGGIINKGEIYERTTLKNGYIYTWKSHLECQQLVRTLKMEDTGEGITYEIFAEYITEVYKEICGYKAKLPSFAEQLKIVIKHKLTQ